MPKMKTAKCLAKRFKKTKSGQYLRFRSGGRHLKTSKSPKRVRRLRSRASVAGGDCKRLKQSVHRV